MQILFDDVITQKISQTFFARTPPRPKKFYSCTCTCQIEIYFLIIYGKISLTSLHFLRVSFKIFKTKLFLPSTLFSRWKKNSRELLSLLTKPSNDLAKRSFCIRNQNTRENVLMRWKSSNSEEFEDLVLEEVAMFSSKEWMPWKLRTLRRGNKWRT